MAAALYRARPIENFDSAFLHLQTAEQVDIRLFFSHSCGECVEPTLHLEAEKGTFDWVLTDDWSIRNTAGELLASGKSIKPQPGMFADVVARCTDPGRFIYTPELAFTHTFCVEQMQKFFPVRTIGAAANNYDVERGLYLVKNQETLFRDDFAGRAGFFGRENWTGERPPLLALEPYPGRKD